MSNSRSRKILLAPRKKAGKRILVHRKTEQFKTLVQLVREAHARTTGKQEESAVTITIQS